MLLEDGGRMGSVPGTFGVHATAPVCFDDRLWLFFFARKRRRREARGKKSWVCDGKEDKWEE